MKSYTHIEQSKKLAEILPIKSADMYWFVPADNEGAFVEEIKIITNKTTYYLFDGVTDWDDTPYIPAWSLAALLDIFPMVVGIDMGMYCCWQNDENLHSRHYDNPVDACYEMILKLHELNLL